MDLCPSAAAVCTAHIDMHAIAMRPPPSASPHRSPCIHTIHTDAATALHRTHVDCCCPGILFECYCRCRNTAAAASHISNQPCHPPTHHTRYYTCFIKPWLMQLPLLFPALHVHIHPTPTHRKDPTVSLTTHPPNLQIYNPCTQILPLQDAEEPAAAAATSPAAYYFSHNTQP